MNNSSYSGNIVDITAGVVYQGTINVSDGKIISISRQSSSYISLDSPSVMGLSDIIMPGLIDSHIHIESSMLAPSEFARIASVHGTVATVSDPHEIANVMGIEGVKFMIDNGHQVPFKFYFGAPSCVPATPFETSGGTISSKEIEELLSMNEIKYLSEMMNFPGVINEIPFVIEIINLAKKANKPIDGHAPGLMGNDLNKYISAGISTDHECFTLEEALDKIGLGMKILIREGSAAKNFSVLHPLITSHPDMVMFCSDDKHPDDLVIGHINDIVRRALKIGHNLKDILRISCLNPVLHYKLDCGLLRVYDPADFIIIDSFNDFNIKEVFIDGIQVAKHGLPLIEQVNNEAINNFKAEPVNPDQLAVQAKSGKIKVIDVIPEEIVTGEFIYTPKITGMLIMPDIDADILKIAVMNRYLKAEPSVAFIRNFGLKSGAMATSVAHDSHNIVSIGADDDSIARAINSIIASNGGMAVVADGKISTMALPLGGIMSTKDYKTVAKEYEEMDRLARELGSKPYAPFMTLSFMSLIVIPKLKLSDKGLFDVEKFEFTDLYL